MRANEAATPTCKAIFRIIFVHPFLSDSGVIRVRKSLSQPRFLSLQGLGNPGWYSLATSLSNNRRDAYEDAVVSFGARLWNFAVFAKPTGKVLCAQPGSVNSR